MADAITKIKVVENGVEVEVPIGVSTPIRTELDKKANQGEVLRNINFEEVYVKTIETYMYNLVDLYYKGKVEASKLYIVNEIYVGYITFIGSGCLVRFVNLANHYFHESENPINQSTNINSITYRTTDYQEKLIADNGININGNKIKLNESVAITYVSESFESAYGSQVFTKINGEWNDEWETGFSFYNVVNTNHPIWIEIETQDEYGNTRADEYWIHFEDGLVKLYSDNEGEDISYNDIIGSFVLGGPIYWENSLSFENPENIIQINVMYVPGYFSKSYEL